MPVPGMRATSGCRGKGAGSVPALECCIAALPAAATRRLPTCAPPAYHAGQHTAHHPAAEEKLCLMLALLLSFGHKPAPRPARRMVARSVGLQRVLRCAARWILALSVGQAVIPRAQLTGLEQPLDPQQHPVAHPHHLSDPARVDIRLPLRLRRREKLPLHGPACRQACIPPVAWRRSVQGSGRAFESALRRTLPAAS